MLAHCGQRVTYQRAAVVGFYRSNADLPFGKIDNLQCAWVLNQFIDVIDNQLFR
ncbi:hypothetical protein D3C75_1146940 [compost metagenome]